MPPILGIIIPTFNRSAQLLECLRHLETQTTRDFEVLIVDDGSTDDTVAQLERYTASFPLRTLQQPNSGPARARNLALQHLTAPICLFLGDDTFPTPNLVATHLAFHRQHPELEAAAVGYTRWAQQGQIVTPFMRWLEAEGIQFAYRALLAGQPPTWAHFYTSNLSVKTALLQAHPFNETFRSYGLEDTELGYRLTRLQNLKMFFLSNAIADHLHPVTLSQICRRSIQVGAAQLRFEQLWPEQHPTLAPGLKGLLLTLLSRPVILPLFTLVTRFITRLRCPNPLLSRLLQCYRLEGYRKAKQAEAALSR